ncbi:MAG: hypothetical protein LLF94_00790 [Chlamydiales bacterium]|nr:hypothetical protein [Chlamydiales bacterium]
MQFLASGYSYVDSWYSGRSFTADNVGIDAHKEHDAEHVSLTLKRTLQGRILINDGNQHLRNQKINFLAVNCLGFTTHLGSARTDNKDGTFEFKYAWTPGHFSYSQHIVMQLVADKLPFTTRSELLKSVPFFKQEALLKRIPLTLPLDQAVNNVGDIVTTFDDISKDITVVAPPLPNHQQSPEYIYKFLKAVLPEVPKRVFVSIFGRFMSAETVQKIYDSFGPTYAKRPLTKENLLDELLNHVSATKAVRLDEHVMWEANWDEFELEKDDGLPNVTVTASQGRNNSLNLESIIIKFRNSSEVLVEVGDKGFETAMYLARSVFALKGEAEFHLAEGHILPGIAAGEFFKHMTGSPLYAAMQPHLSQIDFINWIGSKGVIFGQGSVLDVSSLTAKAVAEVIIKAVKDKSRWDTYEPQEPLCDSHYLAKAEKYHFNFLNKFFTWYIKKNRDEISRTWFSVYAWSQSINEHFKDIPRITENQENPDAHDFESLSKFSAWLISKTTFLHWAAHSRQQVLTDVSQATLAVENKAVTADGKLAKFGNTLAANASEQLFIARTLLNFDGDALADNPFGDMNKELLARFLKSSPHDYEGYVDYLKQFITVQI